MHHLLRVPEHAIGNRVVVADGRVGELPDEGIGVEAERVDGVVERLSQQRSTRAVLRALEELAETRGDARRGRHAADAGVGLVPGPFRLAERELAHQEERLARRHGNPVRIAAARVEHGDRARLRRFVGDLDQLVLQLEGAQLAEVQALVICVHGNLCSFRRGFTIATPCIPDG